MRIALPVNCAAVDAAKGYTNALTIFVQRPDCSLFWAVTRAVTDSRVPDADAGDGLQDIIKINRANPQRAGAHKRWRGAGA